MGLGFECGLICGTLVGWILGTMGDDVQRRGRAAVGGTGVMSGTGVFAVGPGINPRTGWKLACQTILRERNIGVDG